MPERSRMASFRCPGAGLGGIKAPVPGAPVHCRGTGRRALRAARSTWSLALAVALGAAAHAGARERPLAQPGIPPRQGPLPRGVKAASSHAPYEAGDCGLCHVGSNPRRPGPLRLGGNRLCLSCHQEFRAILARRHRHPPAAERCLHCHNAHDSRQPRLLHLELAAGCLDCHRATRQAIRASKVKHGALERGRKCASCHDPHAADRERLLARSPLETCLGCHSVDGLKDRRGVRLTNFLRLLSANPVQHAPVAAGDCTACHRPHGGDNFRMLVAEYPLQFYAPYAPGAYALCWSCHDEKVVAEPRTRTLTNFRDGTRNLHFLHVNKADRGRTCRACHEVHAGQAHLLRDGVPYGPKGWTLPLHYTRTATGGSCARTCHEAKTYVNRAPAGSAPRAGGGRP